jgi:hypothetical protein
MVYTPPVMPSIFLVNGLNRLDSFEILRRKVDWSVTVIGIVGPTQLFSLAYESGSPRTGRSRHVSGFLAESAGSSYRVRFAEITRVMRGSTDWSA